MTSSAHECSPRCGVHLYNPTCLFRRCTKCMGEGKNGTSVQSLCLPILDPCRKCKGTDFAVKWTTATKIPKYQQVSIGFLSIRNHCHLKWTISWRLCLSEFWLLRRQIICFLQGDDLILVREKRRASSKTDFQKTTTRIDPNNWFKVFLKISMTHDAVF